MPKKTYVYSDPTVIRNPRVVFVETSKAEGKKARENTKSRNLKVFIENF